MGQKWLFACAFLLTRCYFNVCICVICSVCRFKSQPYLMPSSGISIVWRADSWRRRTEPRTLLNNEKWFFFTLLNFAQRWDWPVFVRWIHYYSESTRRETGYIPSLSVQWLSNIFFVLWCWMLLMDSYWFFYFVCIDNNKMLTLATWLNSRAMVKSMYLIKWGWRLDKVALKITFYFTKYLLTLLVRNMNRLVSDYESTYFTDFIHTQNFRCKFIDFT